MAYPAVTTASVDSLLLPRPDQTNFAHCRCTGAFQRPVVKTQYHIDLVLRYSVSREPIPKSEVNPSPDTSVFLLKRGGMLLNTGKTTKIMVSYSISLSGTLNCVNIRDSITKHALRQPKDEGA